MNYRTPGIFFKSSTNPDSSGTDNANITTYQYDLQGSLLKEESADFCRQYLYNDFHQCIQTDVIRGREESAERLVQENLYDGEGLRFAIIENGKRTGFITDGWNNVAEIDENGRATKRIIRGMGIVASEDTEQKEDNIFTSAYHYYHGNERMDVEYITDEAGNVVNSYTYDAFGGIISSNETIPNRYTYNGEAFDKITEQYYLRKRYYNPKLCRFTQEDEYRGDGLNLYAFCANNPVMYVDPSGYKCETGAEADRDADESATGGNRQASQNDVDEAVQSGSESGTDSIGNIGNPSDNPKVLADAMEDSAAVYGYRPREDGSIKQFANYDWSDPKVVAELREIRLDYLQENRSYQNMVDNMRNAGCSDTEIAQRLVAERNAHRLSYYVDETGKIINEDLYRQAVEHCVSYEDLRKGINGKSPKTDLQIIESAMKSNPGYDACCGLYGH